MPKLSKKKLLILGFLAVFLCFPKVASAATYYVATNGSDSNPGAIDRPWRTIQKAANSLQPGDTVYVRGGTYQEDISPARSGTAGSYITFAAYPGETPTINLSSGSAIDFDGRQYIEIDGFTVDMRSGGAWVDWISYASHNILRNNTMKNASGGDHGIGIGSGEDLRFINNKFINHGSEPGGSSDALRLNNCVNCLVDGNYFKNSVHACLGMESGYSVIRNNYFSNDWEKNVNCGGGDSRSDHNLWEGNTFATTLRDIDDDQDSPGIQMELSRNILRYNVFYENEGGGYRPEGYGTKASRVRENRVYNNVFYNNNLAGIYFYNYEGKDLSNSLFKNNILYRNSPDQIRLFGRMNGMEENKFFYNNIVGNINHSSIGSHSLSWWQANYSSYFANNFEVDPQFANESSHDFHLKSSSPMRDAGAHLAQASSSGSGTNLQVDDALYFYDGLGIVEADWIKIGDQSPVQINSINYDTKTITLKQSRTWTSGAPVYLYKDSSGRVVLAGSQPDIGAFEYEGAQPTPTPTPNPYDLNDDKKVNAQDVIVLLSNYLSSLFLRADFNDDGQVNGIDFALLLQQL